MLANSAMTAEDMKTWTHSPPLPCWPLWRLHSLGDRQVEETPDKSSLAISVIRLYQVWKSRQPHFLHSYRAESCPSLHRHTDTKINSNGFYQAATSGCLSCAPAKRKKLKSSLRSGSVSTLWRSPITASHYPVQKTAVGTACKYSELTTGRYSVK